MLTGIFFVTLNGGLFVLSIIRGPLWGLIAYSIIYFSVPSPHANWWANFIPDIRWSLISSLIVVISLIIHRDKISRHKFRSAVWVFPFYILTLIITQTISVDPISAKEHTYMLLTFCITIVLIVKTLSNLDEVRIFILVIIGLAANLSIKAYLHGKRIHARLEGIGPADAMGSNEFGILLAAIIPLALPFLFRGKLYEKIFCLLSLVFIVNAFILCNSRGAFLSFIVAGVYVFFFIANRKIKKYLVISSLCIIPALLYLADEHFVQRISSLWRSEIGSEESLDQLTSGRWLIFKHGLLIAKDNPMGAGPEGFRALARFYMPEDMLTFRPGSTYGVRAAHNSYLQVLVEQGIIGLILFLIICFYTMYLLFSAVRIKKGTDEFGTWNDFLLIGLNMSFVCTLAGGMVGSQVYYEFFWWQIALSVVIYSFAIDKREEMIERS